MSTWKRVLVQDDAVGSSGLGISCVDGDNSDEEKIRLSDGTNNDDVVLEAGTGLSIARAGDKITFTNTVSDTNTMGNGFNIGADTDSNSTTIVEGETLTIAGGTNITTETTADGTVTINCGVTDTNTQNSYAISCVDGDNSDEEKIRLTQSGAGGSATDDIVLEAGTGLSVARSGDKITFTNTVSDTNTMGNGFNIGADTDSNSTTIVEGETLTIAGGTNITTETTADGTVTINCSVTDTNTQNSYAISCVDGDNADEEKIRLTQSGAGGSATDDIVLEAGTGLSVARSGDKITFTNTVSDTNTMGNGFSIGADTDSNATTIVEGETLTIAGGSNCSTETTADGTVTINADNDDVSNANLLTALSSLESAGGASDQNIVIGTDSGDTIVITGNLQVDGTTTTVNSTTLTVDDKNIVVASGAANVGGMNGAGISVDATTNSVAGYNADPQLQWNSTHTTFSQWKMVKGVSGESNAFVAAMTTAANYAALDALTPGIGTFAMVGGVPYIQTA